jgi:hypothetical protein
VWLDGYNPTRTSNEPGCEKREVANVRPHIYDGHPGLEENLESMRVRGLEASHVDHAVEIVGQVQPKQRAKNGSVDQPKSRG